EMFYIMFYICVELIVNFRNLNVELMSNLMKRCVICNTEFESKRTDAEVCSASCRQKNWRRKKEAGETTQETPQEPEKIEEKTPEKTEPKPSKQKQMVVKKNGSLEEELTPEQEKRLKELHDKIN